MATEETVISLDQFYARATRRKEQGRLAWQALKAQRHRKHLRPCAHCGGQYKRGHYSKHSLEPEHLAKLVRNRSNHTREKERRRSIKLYWARRGIDIDTATSLHALDDLNNSPTGHDRRVARLEDIREDVPA